MASTAFRSVDSKRSLRFSCRSAETGFLQPRKLTGHMRARRMLSPFLKGSSTRVARLARIWHLQTDRQTIADYSDEEMYDAREVNLPNCASAIVPAAKAALARHLWPSPPRFSIQTNGAGGPACIVVIGVCAQQFEILESALGPIRSYKREMRPVHFDIRRFMRARHAPLPAIRPPPQTPSKRDTCPRPS